MSGYVIFDVGPFDRSAMAPYLEKVFDMITAHGGKFIGRTDKIEVRESTQGPGWHPSRILIIEFPSFDAAKGWYDSPEYQAILPIRLAHGKDNVVIVEGLPQA